MNRRDPLTWILAAVWILAAANVLLQLARLTP